MRRWEILFNHGANSARTILKAETKQQAMEIFHKNREPLSKRAMPVELGVKLTGLLIRELI